MLQARCVSDKFWPGVLTCYLPLLIPLLKLTIFTYNFFLLIYYFILINFYFIASISIYNFYKFICHLTAHVTAFDI